MADTFSLLRNGVRHARIAVVVTLPPPRPRLDASPIHRHPSSFFGSPNEERRSVAQKRLDVMRQIKTISRLYFLGRIESRRRIARAVGAGKSAVAASSCAPLC